MEVLKRKKKSQETSSPLDAAVRDQEEILAASIRQDTGDSLKLRSETIKLEQEAKLAEIQSRLVKAKKEVKDMADDDEKVKAKPKRTYTAIGGEVFRDDESDLPLSEALQLAAHQREIKGPAYFVQNEETGKFEPIAGPAIVKQPTPAIIYAVDNETGEVKQMQPGEPVVVKQAPHQAPSSVVWVYDQAGQLQRMEVKPGEPVMLPPPAPRQQSQAIVVVDPATGVVQHIPPGEPIIVKQSAPQQTSMVDLSKLLPGADGQIPFRDSLEWFKTIQTMRHEDEMHKAKLGLVETAKEEFPRALRAYTRSKEQTAEPPQQGNAPQLQAAMNYRQCSACGMVFGVPKGIEHFMCPNPECPNNRQPEMPPEQQPVAEEE